MCLNMNIYYLLLGIRLILINRMIRIASGQSYEEMESLVGHLFNESRYNKFLRPLHNQSHTIEVNFTQHLTNIEMFDISTGELEFTEFFQITWTDELLTWDPSLYNEKKRMPLPNGKFWKPEIVLRSGTADTPALTESIFSPAWVNYQGMVSMVPVCSFKVRCSVDTTLYPFDKHECNFTFIVSNHDSTELSLHSPTKVPVSRNLGENGEWEVENIAETVFLRRDEKLDRLSIPMARTSLTLKRRPLSALIYDYAPSQLLSILSLLTCFVRPDSGERLTFAVTLYLAFVFTTTSIVERIPNNSLKMPIISYFIITVNIINAVSVTWSIFVVHLAKITLIRKKLPLFLSEMVMKNKQNSTSNKNNKIKPVNEPEQLTNVQGISDWKINEESEEVPSIKGEQLDKISGLELSSVLDRIYFWFLTLMLSFVYMFFFVYLLSK